MYQCSLCQQWFHIECLKVGALNPSALELFPLWGDTNYEFQCVLCSPHTQEVLVSQEKTWPEVIKIAMVNLRRTSLCSDSPRRFFKTFEISEFVTRHWTRLTCGFSAKKNTKWTKASITCALENSPHIFADGRYAVGLSDQWALAQDIDPWFSCDFPTSELHNRRPDYNQFSSDEGEPGDDFTISFETLSAPTQRRRGPVSRAKTHFGAQLLSAERVKKAKFEAAPTMRSSSDEDEGKKELHVRVPAKRNLRSTAKKHAEALVSSMIPSKGDPLVGTRNETVHPRGPLSLLRAGRGSLQDCKDAGQKTSDSLSSDETSSSDSSLSSSSSSSSSSPDSVASRPSSRSGSLQILPNKTPANVQYYVSENPRGRSCWLSVVIKLASSIPKLPAMMQTTTRVKAEVVVRLLRQTIMHKNTQLDAFWKRSLPQIDYEAYHSLEEGWQAIFSSHWLQEHFSWYHTCPSCCEKGLGISIYQQKARRFAGCAAWCTSRFLWFATPNEVYIEGNPPLQIGDYALVGVVYSGDLHFTVGICRSSFTAKPTLTSTPSITLQATSKVDSSTAKKPFFELFDDEKPTERSVHPSLPLQDSCGRKISHCLYQRVSDSDHKNFH